MQSTIPSIVNDLWVWSLLELIVLLHPATQDMSTSTKVKLLVANHQTTGAFLDGVIVASDAVKRLVA
jgi:hypothetical protein